MKRIVFTGGGTAGHIMPNMAIIEQLKSSYDCVYVGVGGMEKSICERYSVPFYHTPAVKLRRDTVFRNVAVPFKLLSCIKRAKKLLTELKPNLVFSKGGYAALPTALAAAKLGVPLICHESDMSAGLTTKLCARRAAAVLCAFEPCAKTVKNGVYAGTPLRKSLFLPKTPAKGKPRLTVVGGSSGAAAINDATVKAAPMLCEKFEVTHITGGNKSNGFCWPGYNKIGFCEDMPRLYAATDVAVTRAGANALAELIALGIPCVAIPLEKASRGDQLENAKYYAEKGAISVLYERDLTPSALADAIERVYNARSTYIDAMRALEIDGTDKICEIIEKRIN